MIIDFFNNEIKKKPAEAGSAILDDKV